MPNLSDHQVDAACQALERIVQAAMNSNHDGEVAAVRAAAAGPMYRALKHAAQFIRNGVEFGYIRMPDADCPDTAHDTLPEIEAAIALAEGRTSPAAAERRAA